MAIEYVKPDKIEQRSFEIIRSELPHKIDPDLAPIILRVIHTTADFEYAGTLSFSEGVVEHAVTALKRGVPIVSDTNMVKAGVDKARLSKLDSKIYCFISDDDVAEKAGQNGITRACAAIDKSMNVGRPVIFAIGNAPTALMRICELKEAGKCSPELVIGVPVGFVNVVEAKEMLMRSGIPFITAQGRKGGSNVAAAICNALLRMAVDEEINV